MDCIEYHHYYYSVIEKDFAAIPSKHLEHLRSCPMCRRQIEQLEQALGTPTDVRSPAAHEYLALHFRMLEQAADCSMIKPFLPCLATASLMIYCRTPVTAHLEACPACRRDFEKVLALQMTDAQLLEASRLLATDQAPGEGFSEQAVQVLALIRSRPSSGVLTVAVLSEQDDVEPLQVESLRSAAAPAPRHSMRTWRTAASGLAAAVVLFAVLLFIGTPSAGALDLHQFYEALAGAQNLSIRTLAPEESEPVQHIWISQTQGLRLIESAEKSVLYDLGAKEMTLRDNVLFSSKVMAVASAPDDLQLPWGLLPFRNVMQIAEGFHWKRVNTLSEGQLVVYELTWTKPLSGRRFLEKKWVGYIDRTTHLPERIEWYERFSGQLSYRLLMTMEITYPKTEEVLEAVRQSGLKDGGYGNQR